MRKFGCVVLATLLVASAASAAAAQSLSAGGKLGFGFANQGGDVEDTNSKTGFSVGAFFGIQLHDYFRLQFDGQYVQKGTSDEVEGGEFDFNLDYIELLVPAILTIPISNSSITPRFYLGPAFAIEVGCGVSATGSEVSIDVACDEFSEASGGQFPNLDTKSIDFGILFGGGADVGVGVGAITFDFLYNLGLTDINDVAGATGDIKNRNLQIVAGYRFFFGG